MKRLSFNEILHLDFELAAIFAQRQKWIDGVLFKREKPRNAGALIYLNGCTGQYTDLITGKGFYAPLKSLVYLPFGGKYTILNMKSNKASVDAYLVECNIVFQGEPVSLAEMPVMIENFNPYYIEKIMSEIVDCYESAKKPICELKSKIYELLAYVCSQKDENSSRLQRTLKPAMEHIEKNVFSPCSVDALAQMCGLSSGGFRRLFKQQMGKTPKEYILDIKLATAKRLLEESNRTLAEISEIINFETTAYFCRFFKSKTGLTPSEYKKLCAAG